MTTPAGPAKTKATRTAPRAPKAAASSSSNANPLNGPRRAGKATPIPEATLANAQAGGATSAVMSRDDWFGPGLPPFVVAPDGVKGRQFAYTPGFNLAYEQKSRESVSGLSFDQLRNLAENYGLLRTVIETRKDQLSKLEWTIRPKVKKGEKASEADKADAAVVEEFLQFPDLEHDFETWARMLDEDLFVIDQPAVLPIWTLGGAPYALEIIDGGTITRILGEDGRTPLMGPAYEQILYGVPGARYTRDELYLAPRNPRSWKAFGLSPVEQIALTINIALRREIHLLQFYTEGNIPEMLIGTPSTWGSDQVRQFQEWFDSVLEGNTAERRHVKFIPGGMDPFPTKAAALTDGADEWLARIVCYAFSVAPGAFVKQQNRATAESAHDQAIEEGLLPLMGWRRRLMNRILRDFFKKPRLEFAFQDEKQVDTLEQAKTDQIYISAGVKTENEVRERLGLDALPEKPAGVLMTPQAAGAPMVPLGSPVPPVGATPPAKGEAPPLPMTSPAPGGDSKIPAAPAAEDDPKAKKAAEKMAKAAAFIAPRWETSKVAQAGKKRIQILAKKWGRSQVNKVAAQVTAGMGKLAKADENDLEAKVEEILESLGFKDEEVLKAGVATVLVEIYEDGGKAALEELGKDVISEKLLEQIHEKAAAWADEHAAALVTQIDEATRDFLRADVVEAINGGYSTSQLADLLADSYAFSDARAECIARTETAKAQIEGTREAWRESGLVEASKFLAAPDCCDECQDVAEAEVALDAEEGELPPLHPNCRCNVVAVMKPADSSSEGD